MKSKMKGFYVVLFFSILSTLTTAGEVEVELCYEKPCSHFVLNVPSPQKTDNYARFKTHLPLGGDQFTICGWFEFGCYGDLAGTPIIYRSNESSLILIEDGRFFYKDLLIGKVHDFGVKERNHLCLVIKGLTQGYGYGNLVTKIVIYINGIFQFIISAPRSHKYDAVINDPGVLTLGLHNTSNDFSTPYAGRIENFMIWDDSLSDQEISNVYNGTYCKDEVFSLDYEDLQLFGAATLHEETYFKKMHELF